MAHEIRMGEGDVRGIIKPLIPFSCIFDTDVGLIQLILDEYASEEYFDLQKMYDLSTDRKQLIKFLYQREHENPLVEFAQPGISTDVMDDLYRQFIESEYEKIIERSVHSGLYELLCAFNSAEEVRTFIYCNNDIEKYYIKSDENLNNMTIIDIGNIDTYKNEFTAFFFKSVNSGLFRDIIVSSPLKSIYILDYRFNFDQGNLKNSIQIVASEMQHCTLNIINAYDINRLEGN